MYASILMHIMCITRIYASILMQRTDSAKPFVQVLQAAVVASFQSSVFLLQPQHCGLVAIRNTPSKKQLHKLDKNNKYIRPGPSKPFTQHQSKLCQSEGT